MKILVPISILLFGIASFVSVNSNSNEEKFQNQLMKDSLMADREKQISILKESLKGKETLQADSVFKNIKSLKGKSTEQVLSIMNGWGHALGVTCKFCHDVNDWASEKSRNHLRTREMIVMNNLLNRELLANMKGFRQPVTMGCISCHNEMKEPTHDGPKPQGARSRPEGGSPQPVGVKN